MTPFFNTSDRIAALLSAATSWLGTPFRENSAVPGPGGGVACHCLVARLYIDAGALPEFRPPPGRARQLLHNPADAILGFLAKNFPGQLDPVFPANGAEASTPLPTGLLYLVRPGDLLVFRERRIGKHVGIALPGREPHHTLRFVHVLRPRGVQFSELSDPTYANAILAIRRPAERSQETGWKESGENPPAPLPCS